MTKHEELAKDLFLEGYNCAQAVLLALMHMLKPKTSTMSLMNSSRKLSNLQKNMRMPARKLLNCRAKLKRINRELMKSTKQFLTVRRRLMPQCASFMT